MPERRAGEVPGLHTDNEELTSLFAGLVLNWTGNATGNIVTVTNELSTLGLPSPVLTSLANTTLPNSGSYGAPHWYKTSPQPSGWSSVGAAICNTISGVTYYVASIPSVLWNGLLSTEAYVANFGHWLGEVTGLDYLLNQTYKVLQALASVMQLAWNLLIAFITTEIKSAINTFLGDTKSVLGGYFNPLNSSYDRAYVDQTQHGGATNSDATGVYTALSGSLLELLTGISFVLGIALLLLTTIALGPGFLVGILVSIIFATSPKGLEVGGVQAISGAGGAAFATFWGLFNATFGKVPTQDVADFATGLTIAADLASITVDPLALFLINLIWQKPNVGSVVTGLAAVLAYASLAAMFSIWEITQTNLYLDAFFLADAVGCLAACFAIRPYIPAAAESAQSLWSLVTGVSVLSVIATGAETARDIAM